MSDERPAVIKLLKELTAEDRVVPSRTKMIAKLCIETFLVMERQLQARDDQIAKLRAELRRLQKE